VDLLEMGQAPVHLATVIGAELRYDHPKDEEAQELLETIRPEGERSALALRGVDRAANVELNRVWDRSR
jgi:hypothetical protein